MSLETFVGELFETGRVCVPSPAELSTDDEAAADGALFAFERAYRREMPAQVPRFDIAAARVGAVAMYRVCQFLVYRDTEAAEISSKLAVAVADPPVAATYYSADLTLRFLPDAARLARGLNADDPLVEELRKLAGRWPLSSIGMPDVQPASLAGIVDDPCLKALYVDRVIASRDTSRLVDDRVRLAVQAALGIHDELAPEIAAIWKQPVLEEPTS